MSGSAGYTKGQGNLALTARSLASIGEMVREDGEYRGRRIVSATWLHEALTPKLAVTSAAYGHGYGQRRSEAILKAVLGAE